MKMEGGTLTLSTSKKHFSGNPEVSIHQRKCVKRERKLSQQSPAIHFKSQTHSANTASSTIMRRDGATETHAKERGQVAYHLDPGACSLWEDTQKLSLKT